MDATTFDDLNPEQALALQHEGHHALVLAGAGSGKTRVITRRIAWLIATGKAHPSEILALTFTNKAAGEMRERVEDLVGPAARAALVSTFHSACARWLRTLAPKVGLPRNFSIYDSDDQRGLVKSCLKELSQPWDAAAVRDSLRQIDQARNNALSVHEVETQARSRIDEDFAALYKEWERALARSGAVDFGGLIQHVVTLLETDEVVRSEFHRRYRYILVDEFQDTNVAQFRLLQALCGPETTVTAVGDDDQSIYGWRGAAVENMQRFVESFGDVQTIRLERNYRSLGAILEAAHALVATMPERMPKKLRAEREGHTVPRVFIAADDREEAEFVAERAALLVSEHGLRWRDIAVFYRTNAQSRVFEDRFRAASLPYKVVGSVAFFERREVKDVLAWLRLAANPADDMAFLRVANVPSRGLGEVTLDHLRAQREHCESWLDALLHFNKRLPARTNKRTRKGLKELEGILDQLARAATDTSTAQLIELALQETGYLQWLQDSDPESADDRIRNVTELINAAREAAEEEGDDSLEAFLERVALQSAADELDSDDAIQMMTVHTAKGLEFPAVFVTGLEEGLFPLQRRGAELSRREEDEERRLAYVAITRAEDHLYLCAAQRRRLYGTTRWASPSAFLEELVDAHASFDEASAVKSLSWREERSPGAFGQQAPAVMWDEFDQRPTNESTFGSERRAAVPEEGVVFDERFYPDESVESAKTYVGRQASHKTFGLGTIVEADPTGDRVRLTIEFPSVGRKKVIARYVEILS